MGLQNMGNFASLNYKGRAYSIDGRGDGGIIFAPPSCISDGTRYSWTSDEMFGKDSIKSPPKWLITLLNESNLPQLHANDVSKKLTATSFIDELEPTESSLNDDTLQDSEVVKPCHLAIAQGMVVLLKSKGLEGEFTKIVRDFGPTGRLYGFTSHGKTRTCIHGHNHNGSNNFTLIKKGWQVTYRCFGDECSTKPNALLGNLPLEISLLDASRQCVHGEHDHQSSPQTLNLSTINTERWVRFLAPRMGTQNVGLGEIFSRIYLLEGRILCQGKNTRYWNGSRWILDDSKHINLVFQAQMTRIVNWYRTMYNAEFRKYIENETDKGFESEKEWQRFLGAVNSTKRAVKRMYEIEFEGAPYNMSPPSRVSFQKGGNEVTNCLNAVTAALNVQENLESLFDVVNATKFACANGVVDLTTGDLEPFHPSHLCSNQSTLDFIGLSKLEKRPPRKMG
jgi:hypothetical protein